MSDSIPSTGSRPVVSRQILMLGGVFAVVTALLTAAYFLFLRVDYVVLFSGLRETDAAAIKSELEKKGVDFRLREGGATILVPQDQADAARLEIAGSEVGERGLVGFELFNKSDMGLTNFAQKINYQRALQGELVRTITAMDGVDTARVHLALPERSLFRGERHEPSAAVTISMKTGRVIDPSRVAGVQRLVAAAVPDLPEAKVVVLDSAGRIVSPVLAMASDLPTDVEERDGVEQYYRARARQVIEQVRPGLVATVRVLVLPSEIKTRDAGEGRNYQLRLIVVTDAGLDSESQNTVREEISKALKLVPAAGDELLFEVGPTRLSHAVPLQPQMVQEPLMSVEAQVHSDSTGALWWTSPLLWAGLALLFLTIVVVRGRARRHPTRLNDKDREAFAEQLRRQLRLSGPDDAAA